MVDSLGMFFLDLDSYLYKFYLPPVVPLLGTTESRPQAAECLQKLNSAVVMVVGVVEMVLLVPIDLLLSVIVDLDIASNDFGRLSEYFLSAHVV